MSSTSRTLQLTTQRFVRGAEVAAQPVTTLEGLEETGSAGSLAIKALLNSEHMLFMEAQRSKGLIDVEHSHPDHDSICYLVRGRMRVVIDGEEFIAEPGDCWIHPAGVLHYHETLEDSVQVEVKSPPRKTWT